MWAYFDPLITSREFLPFLAHWVGWEFSPYLSLTQQRYLVRQAMELYRWRGTRYGLRLYLHLYTGLPMDENLPETEKHICIEETFGDRFAIAKTTIGAKALLGGGQHSHFKVKLKTIAPYAIDERQVRQIIEQEKPAFCTYELYID